MRIALLDKLMSYLSRDLKRPGRLRLFDDGFEHYGHTLKRLPDYTHPLVFESGVEGAEYGVAGTCFLVGYRNRWFGITAKHCLTDDNREDVCLAINPRTKAILPIKNIFLTHSSHEFQDFADIAVFEVVPNLLEQEERDALGFLDFNALLPIPRNIPRKVKLVVTGFPKILNSVDYESAVIKTQRYYPSARYIGPGGEPGVERLEFDELDQIDWPDGMSGAPVFFIEEFSEAYYFGFLGMLIKAQRDGKEADFLHANLIMHALTRIIEEIPAG